MVFCILAGWAALSVLAAVAWSRIASHRPTWPGTVGPPWYALPVTEHPGYPPHPPACLCASCVHRRVAEADADQLPPEAAHRWGPRRGDAARIRAHLDRQAGVPSGFVRLDDGQVVAEGSDALGEGGPW